MNLIIKFFDKYPEDKIVKFFKKICTAEAISCFLLYCVAMVWRRYDPDGILSMIFIILIGNIHGLFFVIYLVLCIPARKIYTWDDEDFVFALLASLFPFATIWIDKSLAKKCRN